MSGDDDEDEEELGMGGGISGDEDGAEKMKNLDINEVER